jgi:hypothetical protein
MAKERGRNMIEGWEEMIRHEGSMGLFPGTADTTNFEESKALAIKWRKEDLCNAKFYSQNFAIRLDFVRTFYETFMVVLRDDDPFERLKTRFEDEEVEKLVCLDASCQPREMGLKNVQFTPDNDEEYNNMTLNEQQEDRLRRMMEKLKSYETPEEATELGKRVGKALVELQKQKGMLLIKVLDDGFGVIPIRVALSKGIEQCDGHIARTYEIVKKFGVEADFVRAFFNGEKEIFVAEAHARREALDLNDMYKAGQPFCSQSS